MLGEKQIPHTAKIRRVREDNGKGKSGSLAAFGMTTSRSDNGPESKSRSLTPLADGASGFGMTNPL